MSGSLPEVLSGLAQLWSALLIAVRAALLVMGSSGGVGRPRVSAAPG
ncbi:hypothetical protein [Blastococcus capsensis]|nr:hypothetical protein [Blastococcus capsensis]MDK3256634.1 hypothetical protein [Blastococcus capsensis]